MSKKICCSRKWIHAVSCILVLNLAADVVRGDIVNGLVGYYPLDEGAGTIAYDISGSGHDGTLHNGVTWISEGYQGGAVNFDATTNTRIELGTWNPAQGTGQISIATWIRWTGPSGPTYQGLVGKRDTWPDTTMFQFQVRPENDGTFRFETGSYAIVSPNGTLAPYVETWIYVTATFDGTICRLYLNGQEVASGAFALNTAGEGSDMGIGCVTGGGDGYSGNGEGFSGDMDEVRIYNRALSASDIQEAMEGVVAYNAVGPNPASGQTDVLRDTVLSWEAGRYAVTHDVYFGTVFEDVNDATIDNPLGVLVAQGINVSAFDPGRLTFEQTYYWRVDEVNGAPDYTVFKGSIWSFTVEPLAYPIPNVIATSNMTVVEGQEPQNLVDGSGLNADDEHSTDAGDMWTGVPNSDGSSYVQFEFDDVYKLHEMLVWNYNIAFEFLVGFGVKDVTVEYSQDGIDWIVLSDVQLAQGPGKAGYTYNTVVPLEGVIAKYVRLTINSSWSPVATAHGLSEVRFLYVPVVASDPTPANAASTENVDVTLAWRPGREAGRHEVIFDTNRAAVVDESAVVASTSGPSFDLAGQALRYGTAYYWAINEVNDTNGSAFMSPVWGFTTPEYMVLDDFDQYDDACNRIYFTWQDGIGHDGGQGIDDCDVLPYGGNGSGSFVGYSQAPFAEQTITHFGGQSMPVTFDNSMSPYYSEIETMDFALSSNWSKGEPTLLSLYFLGRPAAFKENPDGTLSVSGAGADIWSFSDEFRYVYKRLNGDGSITAKVESMIPTNGWAKVGVMIREAVGPSARHASTLVTPSNGISFHRRSIASDPTTKTDATGVTAPYWVRISRSGNTFTGEISSDGLTWESMTSDPTASSEQIAMSNNVLIGLAVTSHASGILTVGEFSNVSTSGNVTGAWQVADVGVEQPSNAAAPVYLALEDSTGRMQKVVHPDPAASQAAGWTEWEVPLSQFNSLNLGNVKKISLGIGDRDNPQAGGSGIMYFDDLRIGRKFESIGLFAYYALESNADDSSGNGYDGVVVGGPEYIVGAMGDGMALEFDGAGGQYVDLGKANPSRTGRLSAVLWAKWNGLSGFYQGLMGKRDSWADGNVVWDLEINITSGNLYIQTIVDGAAMDVTMDPLVQGQWTHIAATFDGDIAILYRNGEPVAGGPFALGYKPNAALVLGAAEANGGNPFNGALDEVRIYDMALTEQDVLELMGQ